MSSCQKSVYGEDTQDKFFQVFTKILKESKGEMPADQLLKSAMNEGISNIDVRDVLWDMVGGNLIRLAPDWTVTLPDHE